MNAIVIGASSDIGAALCLDLVSKNWNVSGTFRTESDTVKQLQSKKIAVLKCDISRANEVDAVSGKLVEKTQSWDLLVLGPGLMSPIGNFTDIDFNEWADSIEVNFTNQVRFVRRLLPSRSQNATVLFFAGGGTNTAPTRTSAYTVSKIALIKMTELLAAEIPDTKFVIVGPGWVNTKIHKETLAAGKNAGSNLEKTLEKFETGDFTPMKTVVDCCNWLIESPIALVSGRNFSVVGDKWNTPELDRRLRENPDLYKLRRSGNN